MSSLAYEIFLSYARSDNQPLPGAPAGAVGWVTALRDHIVEDHRRFSTDPLRIFLDEREIRDMDDWRHRILGALRSSKVLLVCLSPAYFRSEYCQWEWREYLSHQVHRTMGHDSIAAVYFVEIPGSDEQGNAAWMDSVLRGNFTDIRPWFPEGAEALRQEDVRRRLAKLGESLWERLDRVRRALDVPGNLRRQTPYFVGRAKELQLLHERLATGAVGLVTAVHGLGGQGKTELAVAYAHAWAHCYPAGLWALPAEGHRALLPLIGELAFVPEFGYAATEAERKDPERLGRAVLAELQRRAAAVADRDPDHGAAALLLLDNVSDASLLSPVQLAQLPRADWLRLVATTRLGPAQLPGGRSGLAFIAVDALAEDDAVDLIRDHQPVRAGAGTEPAFASASEEAAAQEIVRELGGMTLAVEQVAVHLGLHPEIAPSAYLAGLRRRGLASVDALGADTAVRDQILHQERQLAVVLDATLAMLPEPCLTALAYAARLPADIVPWPWLRALVAQRHPEIGTHDPAEPDPWLTVRRQLDGLRLLTPGDDPEVARMHRLVAAHLGARAGDGAEADEALTAFLTERASAIYDQTNAPAAWELPAIVAALPSLLPPGTTRRGLAYRAVFLARKVAAYHNLPLAEALLAATHPVFASLVVSEPTNTVWQRDLSVSHERVGDVLRDQGDLDGALRDYRESLAIRERLAAGDPANAVWQRDLSVSHNKVGDVLLAQGDLDGALRDYRESLAIRERLAASDPSNAGWQRDLSVSHEKVGAVLHDQGDLNGALRDYRESLAIAERLAASDPANAGWQRDLSSSHCYVGMVLQEQGDLDGALEAYRKYQAGMQRLAASDPSNAGWQRDLSVSHEKVGDVLRSQGDLVGAMRDYRESLAIAERLAASDPANAGWQRDLSVSHERVGDVLRDQADLDGALQAYREDLAIAERLAAGDPSNAGWQRDLWVSYYRLASVAEAAEEPEAKEWWQKAYTVLAGMVERGLFVSSQDMRALASLRGKAGLDSDNG